MKRHNSTVLLALIASALSLNTAPQIVAQNPSAVTSADNPVTRTVPADSTDLNRDRTGATEPSSVSKVNKASSLIGMDVRNTQNEKLGEIKDLVVDLHSGKIAYAVLSVGGFLGIGDKYVAVPPSAFTAPDQDRLVLNADKAKIQNAPSFAKSSWPDVNSPTWSSDSAYWLTEGTAQGATGTIRSGTGAENVRPGVETDSSRRSIDLDREPARSSTTLDKSSDRAGRASTGREEGDRPTFRGRITAINPETRTMTVEGPGGSREFKFSDRPTITLKENRNPRLSDLKVGYPVVVGYHEENGTHVAHSVIRSDTPEVR